MQSDSKWNWNVYVRGDYNSSLHLVQTAVKLKRINPDSARQWLLIKLTFNSMEEKYCCVAGQWPLTHAKTTIKDNHSQGQ